MLSHTDNERLAPEVELQYIDTLIDDLDHKHRIQRKIQFLLDIRGYLKVNHILGAYHEYGLYNGHTLYSAHRILQDTITEYCGFDTFTGEPHFTPQESQYSPYLSQGDYACSLTQVSSSLAHINPTLVKGDFRDPKVSQEISLLPQPSVVIIDCNILSSVQSALVTAISNIIPFGILFIDDFFTLRDSESFLLEDILLDVSRSCSRSLSPFMTYPPFSKAFIIH